MQQLIQEEANRVTAVLEESYDCVNIIGHIPLSVKQLNNIINLLDKAQFSFISKELNELSIIEQHYKDLIKQNARIQQENNTALNNIANGSVDPATVSLSNFENALQSNAAAMEDEASLLKEKIRTIVKHLRREPKALQIIKDVTGNLTSEHSAVLALGSTLYNLVEIAAKQLITTRQQKIDTEIETKNKLGRIENAEREVALLQQELEKQRVHRTQQMNDLNNQLQKVKEELISAQKHADSELKDMHSQGTNKMNIINDYHSKQDTSLHATLEKLQADLKTAVDAHIDAEANVRKRKARARLEAETLVKEYDTALIAAQTAIDEMRNSFVSETAPLEDLRQYYKRIDAELIRLEEERLIAEDKYFHEVTLLNFKKKVVIKKIQRKYRAWKKKKTLIEQALKKNKNK